MSVSRGLSTFHPSLTTAHQKRKVATSKAHPQSALGQLILNSSRHERSLPNPTRVIFKEAVCGSSWRGGSMHLGRTLKFADLWFERRPAGSPA